MLLSLSAVVVPGVDASGLFAMQALPPDTTSTRLFLTLPTVTQQHHSNAAIAVSDSRIERYRACVCEYIGLPVGGSRGGAVHGAV